MLKRDGSIERSMFEACQQAVPIQVPAHSALSNVCLPGPATTAQGALLFSAAASDTATQVEQLPSAIKALPDNSPSASAADGTQLIQAEQRIMCANQLNHIIFSCMHDTACLTLSQMTDDTCQQLHALCYMRHSYAFQLWQWKECTKRHATQNRCWPKLRSSKLELSCSVWCTHGQLELNQAQLQRRSTPCGIPCLQTGLSALQIS